DRVPRGPEPEIPPESGLRDLETWGGPNRSSCGSMKAPRGISNGSQGDEDLLKRVASGDGAAFGVVFDRYAPAALRYARRLVRDGAASEDAVHGAFVRLLEASRSGGVREDRGTLRGLLFRTVRNTCIDWIRLRSRDVPLAGRDRGDGARGADDARLDLE